MKKMTYSLILGTLVGLCACSAGDIEGPVAADEASSSATAGAGGQADNGDVDQGSSVGGGGTGVDPIAKPSDKGFGDLRGAALAELTQTASFDAQDGVSFTSAKGVNLSIAGPCLRLGGGKVSGTIDLSYVEIFDRGSMLTANKSTMGQLNATAKTMLVSGGQFFVEVTQNGQPLELACLSHFTIPSALTGEAIPDPAMKLFNGAVDATTDEVVWQRGEKTPGGGDEEPGNRPGVWAGAQTNYSMFTSTFGWSNVDRFYSDPRPKTDVLATVPTGYDDQNSAVYLSYDGEETGLARLDTYDANEGQFSEHYGLIPVGLNCHMIFVSESNGRWVYAIKSVTIVDGGVEEITESELVTGTQEELLAAIAQLP